MGGGYEEEPEDKVARLRERRITDLARNKAAQDTASGLSSDIRAVYGMKGMIPIVGKAVAPKKKTGWEALFQNSTGPNLQQTKSDSTDSTNPWGTLST